MLKRIFKKIYQYRLMYKIKRQIGLVVGKNLQLRGKPILIIANNAEIRIGNNVTLNSNNDTYHLNLFAPVKIMADKENAKIVIGSNTRIHGSCIHAQKGIYIGENCLIAANSQIFDSDGHELLMTDPEKRLTTRGEAKEIFIEDNVWIGTGCIILKGVRIGQGSVVAAGSVVVKNVPQNSIVGGNPAGIIKQF